MITLFSKLIKNLPTLFLSLVMAIAVWVSAISDADPMEERIYPRSIPIELVGQDPGLLLTSDSQDQVTITLNAPSSLWEKLTRREVSIRAVVDLAGLNAGDHELEVQLQIDAKPIRIVSYSPETIEVELDRLVSRDYSIELVSLGEPAVGFQVEYPVMSQVAVAVAGPEALMDKVNAVQAVLEIEGVSENIDRMVPLIPVDNTYTEIEGLTLSPDMIHISQEVTQRGGFRNVVIKVELSGQVVSGYRVTNISVFPPAVTVFSSDPKLVEGLPGYVNTEILDLTNLKDDLDVELALDLPPGISVVGEDTVEVQVGVASIEGSLTLEKMNVEFVGLDEDLQAFASPETVDVILSGPLNVLESLRANDIHVVVNLEGDGIGTFNRLPLVDLEGSDLIVEAILPASIEIIVEERLPTPSPTPEMTPIGESKE
ncbi:MAG: hypothetical protein JEZ06_08665 [Anaerolineaceae bacterium]|nr:hypothetical protein [Anaerolineaceae bacterium]